MIDTKACTVAFMGEQGSQSNLAAEVCFPDSTLMGVGNFRQVLDAVSEGYVDFGLLAQESLAAGRVDEVHLLLRRFAGRGVKICGEYISPVTHQLAIHRASRLEDIKIVCSHPQALMQCSRFIEERAWTAQGMPDSATAAKRVAEGNRPDIAAICSQKAAEIFGLQVMQSGIQDNDLNATVFAIIGKAERATELLSRSDASLMQTTMLLTLRNETGILSQALGCFAEHEIDVVRIESYIKGCPTETGDVLVTISGALDADGCRKALASLDACTSRIEILGTYPAARERSLSPHAFRDALHHSAGFDAHDDRRRHSAGRSI